MAYPDYEQLLQEIWGWGDETVGMLPIIATASNILVGTNPPYSAADFFSWFPQFAGTPIQVQGTLDGTTGLVTNVSDTSGLSLGLLVTGTGIPCNTTITGVLPNSILLSNLTTQAGTQTLSVFANSTIPICILNSFIYLATSSILQVRYQEMWSYAMALYIAHYLTMWCQSMALGPGSLPGQLATSGVASGLQISRHVGNVSTASEPLRTLNDFGTYALTSYGQQLATFAKAVGSGPVWCW